MSRRIAMSILAVLLVATLCFAQGARNTAYVQEGKSSFTSIGANGLNTAGNPGYIELRGTTNDSNRGSDAHETWYLWVDSTGDLCMSSYVSISAFASFPTGDWSNGSVGGTVGESLSCTKVGGQS